MSVDKLVDSTQLDADLTSVANAIRTKGGTSAQLAFPAGFVSAINDISSGEEYFVVPSTGCIYPKKLDQTLTGFSASNYGTNRWRGCTEMTDAIIKGLTAVIGGQNAQLFTNCTGLKKASLPDCTNTMTYVFSGCSALEEAQIGSVGHAVTGLSAYTFSGCTQSNLSITIYVADNTAIPLANSPFGATNATIVYRSSTTGEVRTS